MGSSDNQQIKQNEMDEHDTGRGSTRVIEMDHANCNGMSRGRNEQFRESTKIHQ